MKILRVVIGVCGLVLAMAGPVAAADAPEKVCSVCHAADADHYGAHIAGALGRGVVNALFGWTELLAQPIHAGTSGENIMDGVNKGVGYTIKRTLSGVGEIVTCWAPPGSLSWTHDCSLGVMGLADR